MKQAIITGSTGFIGSRLTRMLLASGIKVLAIGRKSWKQVDKLRLTLDKNMTYISLNMSEINLLHEKLKKIDYVVHDECVFYHFAWGGYNGLSDLDVAAQVNNINWTVEAFKNAEVLGCSKFVHIGTMEEAFADAYLKLDYKHNDEYNRHVVYSIAKKYAREMLKALSYDFKTDLIVATNSHVMGPNDDKDSFLQKTLIKLINNEKLEFTSGKQIFDVVSVKDCAYAYKLIGEKGKRNKEYWIGSGTPRTLKEYINIMAQLYPSNQLLEFDKVFYNDIKLKLDDFSIKLLQKDTDFIPNQSYEDTVHELFNWLTKNDLNEPQDEQKQDKRVYDQAVAV
jgi:nucleoside-diphosphate-sugar epimerase